MTVSSLRRSRNPREIATTLVCTDPLVLALELPEPLHSGNTTLSHNLAERVKAIKSALTQSQELPPGGELVCLEGEALSASVFCSGHLVGFAISAAIVECLYERFSTLAIARPSTRYDFKVDHYDVFWRRPESSYQLGQLIERELGPGELTRHGRRQLAYAEYNQMIVA